MNHQKKEIVLILSAALFLTGCGSQGEVYLESAKDLQSEVCEEETQQSIEEQEETETEGSLCYVYVCGAVKEPGVYLLQEGSRVYEAIALAGGFTEEAAKEALNQAEPVCDGQMIQVLTVDEAAAQSAESQPEEAVSENGSSDGKININTATVEMLMTLPGVGESKAESIVAYREENGAFSSIEAIKNVNGIKDGVYHQIEDKITVD